jgi:hypothetical protein
VQAGARKNFNDAARPQIWKFEIVRLNQHEGLLDLCISGVGDDVVQDPPVAIGKFLP